MRLRGVRRRAGARSDGSGRWQGLRTLRIYKAILVSPPAAVPSQSIHQKLPLPKWNRAPEGESLARRPIHHVEACTKF